ncbi:hypothetical protein BJY04DRAFT_68038 [Aspergillus karnatakaensis]|uniref:DUF2293 domain-containing protein n=1 Tax=Aspergillus karnatakaensis TaxID=1810916 RepID=UPI003CCE226A
MSAFIFHDLPLALRITRPDNMAPSANPISARKKARKPRRRSKKNRILKPSSPNSSRLVLAQKHARDLAKRGAITKPGTGRSVLTNSNKNPRATESKPNKTAEGRASPRILKYQLATQWSSSEPFEKNCLHKEPLPDNYVFVPRGDVYVTRNCRSKTKESHRLVYKVWDNTGKKALGIRIPSDVYTAVSHSAEETAELRANAVKLRDAKDLAHSRQLLCKQFPLMPVDSLEAILHHAFLKGSGRVGRTSTTSDEHKATLAVEAHIRHTFTPYESLLREGKSRQDSRQAVWETVRTIRAAWEGRATDSQPAPTLTIRNR